MTEYQTVFGSLRDFDKGHIEIINDKPMHYAFSNVFEVASNSAPYEKVAVAKNLENVIEAVRIEGDSPWYTNAHDEFAIVMDGEVEVHVYKAVDGEKIDEEKEGTHLAEGEPKGPKMGMAVLKRGHQCIMPKGCVYQFRAREVGALIQQTIQGPLTVEKWAEICYT
ncbi:PnpC1 [Candidatus Terasakiella magnetica]|uniref:PnpC1 n=1 Tax=Candidatus Terasakiella magnetica TaxID=1867952 RepID=A0A1C3RFG3_9PROT|nr:hydroxyquinol 1,2-dioxygenase [Candidatus Terasakiella magnetica]SCA56033.1 PnpC1 [Candidatus Terasakiella magnetica]